MNNAEIQLARTVALRAAVERNYQNMVRRVRTTLNEDPQAAYGMLRAFRSEGNWSLKEVFKLARDVDPTVTRERFNEIMADRVRPSPPCPTTQDPAATTYQVRLSSSAPSPHRARFAGMVGTVEKTQFGRLMVRWPGLTALVGYTPRDLERV